MAGTRKPHHSSDNFWSSSSKYVSASISFNTKKKDQEDSLSEFLSAVDDSPEFYDPYSDLNLFLSQKIKQEMPHCGSSKKWSLKIQEELLSKITPEFQERFPQLRLGVSALKKSWEKIAYYSQQIEQQKEAITQDGKLNIHFFIKENLKSYTAIKSSFHFQPYHYAHQLASKMSECIAAIDGVRPDVEHLTKMVWSIQRHLLTGGREEYPPCPYDEYDKIDGLIVRAVLEITAKEPQITQHELEYKVKETLQELPHFASAQQMMCNISALLAEKLYPLLFVEKKAAIDHFIQRHISLYQMTSFHPQLIELVRRILALYTLASTLPKNLLEEEIKQGVLAIYPNPTSERPLLPQAVYAFISAELVPMQSEESCYSPAYAAEKIWTAYKEASQLPILQGKESDTIEIAIWKHLSETEGLLEKLPYRIGQRIDQEIAGILIENPHHRFTSLVHETAQHFKRMKELMQIQKWEEIERKIHIWTIQGDMLCGWIRLDPESTLLRLICRKYKEHSSSLPHHLFVSEICQEYLKEYPELAPYIGQLSLRVWILYKYAWYTLFGTPEESSFDRFLKWHSTSLLFSGADLDHDLLVQRLEEIVRKTTPLIPFDKKQSDFALTRSSKE